VAGGDDGGKLRRLPSGRHGLPAEFVSQNQRERLTAGAIAAVVEHGFRDAGVTQIATAAGVSRRTFYEYFASKEECFLDTYDLIEEQLLRIVADEADEKSGWSAKVRARTVALVLVLSENPNLAHFTLAAPAAAGGELVERERTLLRKLIASITDGAPEGRGYAKPSDEELEALAGAMTSVLTTEPGDEAGVRWADTASQLVEMILVPIVGRRRAGAEAEKAGSEASDRLPGPG
jgi:AcrR family transcriptional regulator